MNPHYNRQPGHGGVFDQQLRVVDTVDLHQGGVHLFILNIDWVVAKVIAALQRFAEANIVPKKEAFAFNGAGKWSGS